MLAKPSFLTLHCQDVPLNSYLLHFKALASVGNLLVMPSHNLMWFQTVELNLHWKNKSWCWCDSNLYFEEKLESLIKAMYTSKDIAISFEGHWILVLTRDITFRVRTIEGYLNIATLKTNPLTLFISWLDESWINIAFTRLNQSSFLYLKLEQHKYLHTISSNFGMWLNWN